MPLILPANTLAPSGYTVDNSCRFNDGDSPKLDLDFGSDGTLNKWTFSMWFKRSTLGTAQRLFCCLDTGMDDYIKFGTDDQLEWTFDHEDGSNRGILKTNRKFRDVSAWYHLVCRLDTTDGTAGDRMRMYINGTEETSFATDTNPTQNETGDIGRDNDHFIGTSGSSQYFDGYIAEVCMINNQSLAPTSFGEFDSDTPSVFKPIDVSGLTFGTNGFYLSYSDSADLGADSSGNSNDWTVTNLAATDSATDTPTNNWCVMNSLDNYFAGSTFSEGNTGVVTPTGATTWNTGTFGVSAGKWYWEVNYSAKSNTDAAMIGIAEAPTLSASAVLGNTARSVSYYTNGNKYVGTSGASYGDTYTVGDIIGVALDMDNAKLYFSKNGTWQDSGDPESGATGTGAIGITAAASTSHGFYFPAVGDYGTPTTTAITFYLNFGNPSYTISSGNADGDGYGNFEYAVPSGYYALCTKNLAEYG